MTASSADTSPDLTTLPGIGPAMAEKLKRLGLRTVRDLLFLLPIRYEDRTRIQPISGAQLGRKVQIDGVINRARIIMGRRRSLICALRDTSAEITLRFFHFTRQQQAGLRSGTRLLCYGEVRQGPRGLEMVHPEYRRLGESEAAPVEDRLTPVYPATEGVTQPRLRKLAGYALKNAMDDLPELIPQRHLSRLRLPGLLEALRAVHRPPRGMVLETLLSGQHPARRRLALEEILAWHLGLRRLREAGQQRNAVALRPEGGLRRKFLARLPFDLTEGQAKAIAEIDADLARAAPMMRLLQGDVGCGKTVVIAAAVLAAVQSGRQAAVMAPTELLAEQHMRTLSDWLEPLGVRLAWLVGGMPRAERRAFEAQLASGDAQVGIGTHALFQEAVEYRALGLAVVDEQHRFGVHQRLRLVEKGQADAAIPHQLVTTATPIPRSLAMTFYAGLDISAIRDMPPGRRPVNTALVSQERRAKVIERVAAACRSGRQAYWVCPLIDESEHIESSAVEPTYRELRDALAGIRVGLLHGRADPRQRDQVMADFASGKLSVLVATTVIEVGVDIPRASLMIVENAERMGLAQLHQLRGRVGRGEEESHCVLMYRSPLGQIAKERLNTMRNSNDGFEIARKDLALRGAGEILGVRQTGALQFRVADLVRDGALAEPAQRIADDMLRSNPNEVEQLISRWVGEGDRYAQV
ncbi:MAG: ATP-dependent DNA helicase RecG [Gammaproteobacteria bacterium]|nr:ATP-dependent DNA helicase RecG [Gammaproteobacteria bacterium]